MAIGPQSLYRPAQLRPPAYQLRYGWTGWFAQEGTGVVLPAEQVDALKARWESDGLRLLEWDWSGDSVQMTFSALPQVSPMIVATRAKGRLWHALRASGHERQFSRKIALRTVGNTTKEDVEAYIRRQVQKESFADDRWARAVQDFTVSPPEVDLSLPEATRSGRYWYNLHVVLVVADRFAISDTEQLRGIRDQSFRIAAKKACRISALSVMPDHLHMAVRGGIAYSPEEIALAFLNNLAYALGQRPVWEPYYYVGTFGDYSMRAVRHS